MPNTSDRHVLRKEAFPKSSSIAWGYGGGEGDDYGGHHSHLGASCILIIERKNDNMSSLCHHILV